MYSGCIVADAQNTSGLFADGNGGLVALITADGNGQSADRIMNFGRDSYATMTYYVQDFGTVNNPTLPEELVEINWANTWDDYCNQIADKTGQDFNGLYNLNLKLGLTKQDGAYVLTQTPVSSYETLRDTDHAVILKDAEISADHNPLKDFRGDSYEIVSSFTPGPDTKKIGFRLRTGTKEILQYTR